MKDFFRELIDGKYAPESEDRLTQFFAACFNHSKPFQSLIASFFGLKGKPKNLIAVTQESKNNKGRTDIEIKMEGDVLLTIENKVHDRNLTKRQLQKYKRHRDSKIVGIVKYWPKDTLIFKEFNIYRWSDFYGFIEKKIDNRWNKIDIFVIEGFLNHLRRLGMDRVTMVKKEELESLRKGFHELRKGDLHKIYIPLSQQNIFEIGNRITNVLNDLSVRAKENPVFVKKVGVNFRGNPRISYWHEGEKYPKHVWMSIRLEFPKKILTKKGMVKHLISGIVFESDQYYILIASLDKNLDFVDSRNIQISELSSDKFIDSTINTWHKWLDIK